MNEVLLAITIDTEEEWNWNGPFPLPPFSTRNAEKIGKFQAFCDKLGLKPTWLVDYAMAENPHTSAHLRDAVMAGRCEVGAHLHPWATPPLQEEVNETNSHILNLPPALVEEKLGNLTRKIEAVFGRRPTSFRAGRWGMNGRLLRMLRDAGYTVDTSVHPFYANPHFSYEGAPCEPYWPRFEDLLQKGSQREIFELPATSGFNRTNFGAASRLHGMLAAKPLSALRGVGLLWHARLLRKITLSPELYSAEDMLALAQACIKRGMHFLNLYFHSSSLLPGCTDYVPDAAAEEKFYGAVETFYTRLQKSHKLRPVTLVEARNLLTN